MFVNSLLPSRMTLVGNNAMPSTRGGRRRPRVAVHRVEASSTDTFAVVFGAGQDAIVTVVGNGDTDLDLFVYDEHGHLIAQDRGITDRCAVRWVPSWTGAFRVKVVNLGPACNRYTLRHN